MKDLCPGWYPGMPMDPARERALIRLEMRRARTDRYTLKLIREDRCHDHMTPAERRAYWRKYWATNREVINARRRQEYQEKKAVKFDEKLALLIRSWQPMRMSIEKQAVHSRVDAEAAARFLSEHAGIPVSPRTVLTWARLGRVPCLRLVGRVAFDLAELAAWLDAARNMPAVPTLFADSDAVEMR